jgi:hypothetical protein
MSIYKSTIKQTINVTKNQMNQTNSQTETQSTDANVGVNQSNNTVNSNNLEWSYSGKAMRGQFILYLLISLVGIGGVGYLQFAGLTGDEQLVYFWIGVAILVALIWIQYYAVYFYRVLTIKYKLEDNRLYTYKGLFTQTRDTLELMYVCDIQLVRTLFDIVFNGGVGKVIIFSTMDKTDNKLVITGVDNPYHVVEIIDKTRAKLREQRDFISGNDSSD